MGNDRTPRCLIRNHRGLKALGLKGDGVELSVEEGMLHLGGTAGGAFVLPAASVERIRLFHQPRSLRSTGCHHVEFRFTDGHRPLSLDTLGRDPAAFKPVVAAFARAVAGARGVASLEVGAGGIAKFQQRAQILIGAVAWLVMLGGAAWAMAGLARIAAIAGLLYIGWRQVGRLRGLWRRGTLWQRPARNLDDFLAALG